MAFLALACLLPASPASAQKAPAGAGLARLTYVERKVDQGPGTSPKSAAENDPLRFGDVLRTAPDAMARLEFPWMILTLSPSTVVSFPDELVLQTRLQEGRVVVQSGRREILKLVTPEGEVRGNGRVIVRREKSTTLVTCVDGRFAVTSGGRSLAVPAGKGAVARAGEAPQGPYDLPSAPGDLVPGADPVYVAAGEPVALRWAPRGSAYSVEVMPVGGDTVLAQRDAAQPSLRLPLAWPGAFRWRVAARDERGLEGLPSGDGQIVVE
jgi:hypothetical protein